MHQCRFQNKLMFVILLTFNRLQHEDLTPRNFAQLKKALAQYFSTSSFMREKHGNLCKERHFTSVAPPSSQDPDSLVPNLFVIPIKNKDDSPRDQYESHSSMLWRLRDQVSLFFLVINIVFLGNL